MLTRTWRAQPGKQPKPILAGLNPSANMHDRFHTYSGASADEHVYMAGTPAELLRTAPSCLHPLAQALMWPTGAEVGSVLAERRQHVRSPRMPCNPPPGRPSLSGKQDRSKRATTRHRVAEKPSPLSERSERFGGDGWAELSRGGATLLLLPFDQPVRLASLGSPPFVLTLTAERSSA